MTTRRLTTLAAFLAAFCLIALPVGATAEPAQTTASAAKKKVLAQIKNCTPFAKAVRRKSGSAKQQAKRNLANCREQNKARKIAARQIAGYALVGARGDGMAVDWRHCSNGRWLHFSDGTYGRSSSDGRSWRITHAIVRRGGKWFDAVLTQPLKGGKMSVGIARRGKQFQVAVASFDTDLSSYGDVKRTKITNRDCVNDA